MAEGQVLLVFRDGGVGVYELLPNGERLLMGFQRLAVFAGSAEHDCDVVMAGGEVALVFPDGRVRVRELLPDRQIPPPNFKSLGDFGLWR